MIVIDEEMRIEVEDVVECVADIGGLLAKFLLCSEGVKRQVWEELFGFNFEPFGLGKPFFGLMNCNFNRVFRLIDWSLKYINYRRLGRG